jgi:uncharacterized protein (TIGR03437 family)
LVNFGSPARAQNSTNISLDLSGSNQNGGLSLSIENWVSIGQTGNVAPLGNANLTVTSSSAPVVNSTAASPAQVTAALAFSEADALAISFTLSDPNFLQNTPIMMPGGVITGGTGAYAGASGSLDLSIVNFGVTGTGSLILGGKTTALTLSNFQGACCGAQNRQYNIFTEPLHVSGSLGNASGTMVGYARPIATTPQSTTPQDVGIATITFNSIDSLALGFAYSETSPCSTVGCSPATFSGTLYGGTGRFANATGALNWTTTSSGWSVSGTMTTAPGAEITKVKTAYGFPEVASNTWMEIHGRNLVPPDTPAGGIDWSHAPEFANGQMPTQLGPVSVNFGGQGFGYVYYYCSAVTNPNCADDQINVLFPPVAQAGPRVVIVENNSVPIAVTSAFRNGFSPAFLAYDTVGHVVAQHADYTLEGPANLYPGHTTPAKPGETILLYAIGFGATTDTTIVPGSATQSGTINGNALACWVSGFGANVVGALISPGLYQLNLTVPKGLPSGDHPVTCKTNFYSTFPGSVITVQ